MPISNTVESVLYEPLESPDSFRLLSLKFCPLKQEWKGGLVVERLSSKPSAADPPRYIALSYAWGTPSFNVPEELSIELSFSLSTALGHILMLVSNKDPLNIWIDQLCIDQRNIKEKTLQIDNMWRIYSQAERVIGWLGPEPPLGGIKETFEDLTVFAGPGKTDLEIEQWRQLFKARTGNEMTVDAMIKYAAPVMQPGSDLRRRMLILFKMEWFRRRWIAQEACLASKLDIYCGFYFIPGDTLIRALKLIQAIVMPVASPWLQRPFRNACNLLHAREQIQGRGPISFPHVLQRLSFLDCKKGQDRLNALFGVVRADNSWFKPSYCPVEELYKDFALEHIRHFQSLEILHFAGVTEPTRHTIDASGGRFGISAPAEDLPSWVPDWRIQSRPIPILPAGSYVLRKKQTWSALSNLSYDHQTLTLKGKLLGEDLAPCGLPHLDRFELKEDLRVRYGLDSWCNNMFVNFLEKADKELCDHYRSFRSFTEWHESPPLRKSQDSNLLLLRFARTLIMDGTVESTERPDCQIPRDKALEYFREYAKLHFAVTEDALQSALASREDDYEALSKAATFGYLAEAICRYRTLFVRDHGRLGLGLPGMSPSDRICFFSGLQTPFIVHPKADYYELRGECYVDGLMRTPYDQIDAIEQDIVLR